MRKTVFFLQGIIISILVLVLFTPIIWTSEVPEIRIELDGPGIVFCNTSRNEENILEYNGTISADFSKQKIGFGQVLVSLRANTGGWDWEITPSSTILSKDNERFDFLFQISVPNDCPAKNTNIIRVKGEASTFLGLTTTDFSSKTIEIRTAPYINQSLETSGEGGFLTAGKPNPVDFRLNNLGNVQIKSKMTVLESDYLEAEGWSLYFQEKGNLTVLPFQSVSNTLTILPPSRIEELEIEVNITVTSIALSDDENMTGRYINSTLRVPFQVGQEDPGSGSKVDHDPRVDIYVEEKKLVVSETLKFGPLGGLDLSIYLLLLGIVISVLYYSRYRD